MAPRGIRNNNPGNIRLSRTTYKGEVTPSSDKAFKQFESMAYGYRAVFVTLRHYHTNLGLKTIRQMISRWAPPSENNTGSYVKYVSDAAHYDCDAAVDIKDKNLMVKIVSAMSFVENGLKANQTDVMSGWEMYRRDRP